MNKNTKHTKHISTSTRYMNNIIQKTIKKKHQQNTLQHDQHINYNKINKINKTNKKNISIHNNKNNYDITKYSNQFIISSKKNMAGLDYSSLRYFLKIHGLTETNNPKSHPILLWLEQLDNNLFDKKYYHTKCFIMNILSDKKKIITDKYLLYVNFNKYYPIECKQYMAETWELEEFLKNNNNNNNNNNNIFNADINDKSNNDNDIYDKSNDDIHKKSNVYIVRPVGKGAFSGKGIIRVYDNTTLQNAKSLLHKNYDHIIISKYITNPMLYNGCKFHLRTYFLISIINGKYKTYFYDIYELFTALKPYTNNDYTDKDVHDTHFKSTPQDILCPYDLDIIQQNIFSKYIYPKMKNCMSYISKLMESHAEPYPQAENAFEVFGCDFLVKDNYDVVLMEINDKIGFTMYKIKNKQKFSKLYLNIINNIILKAFIYRF